MFGLKIDYPDEVCFEILLVIIVVMIGNLIVYALFIVLKIRQNQNLTVLEGYQVLRYLKIGSIGKKNRELFI